MHPSDERLLYSSEHRLKPTRPHNFNKAQHEMCGGQPQLRSSWSSAVALAAPPLASARKALPPTRFACKDRSKTSREDRKLAATSMFQQLKAGDHVYLQDSVKGGQTDFNITCPVG